MIFEYSTILIGRLWINSFEFTPVQIQFVWLFLYIFSVQFKKNPVKINKFSSKFNSWKIQKVQFKVQFNSPKIWKVQFKVQFTHNSNPLVVYFQSMFRVGTYVVELLSSRRGTYYIWLKDESLHCHWLKFSEIVKVAKLNIYFKKKWIEWIELKNKLNGKTNWIEQNFEQNWKMNWIEKWTELKNELNWFFWGKNPIQFLFFSIMRITLKFSSNWRIFELNWKCANWNSSMYKACLLVKYVKITKPRIKVES